MQWKTSYLPEQQITIIETQGDANEAGSIEMAQSVLQTMQEHNTLRCLIDHSKISSVSGSTTSIYYRPRQLRGAGVSSKVKIAEVINPAHEAHFAFFETVCHNNGINLCVFKDRESAIQWLTT